MSTPDLDADYAQLRVLVHWHSLPGPSTFSSRQVIVGPCYETVEGPDGFVSIKVPFGPYDIKTVVDRLPPHQRPDVLIVALDATRSSIPLNLAALDCPKALLIGDTHHLQTPLRFMVAYTLAERFDLLVGNHLPQHLHFFRHAGHKRIAWIPGVWVKNFGLPFQDDHPEPPVFVGSLGAYHPYRSQVLDAVRAAGLPLEIRSTIQSNAPQADAAPWYNRAAASLNCSLNGDFNMRVFETLGHGGFLLTDRLKPEAGLTDLFADGEALVCYDDAADLIEKLRAYLARPADALAVARRGFDVYQREHRPEHKARQLFSELAGDGRYPAPVCRDPRADGDASDLMTRMATYECVQELQRATGRLSLFATRGVNPCTLTDLVDLSRVRCRRQAWPEGTADETAAVLQALDYGGRLEVDAAAAPADILLIRSAELAMPEAAQVIASTRPEIIVLADATEETAARDHLAARRYGFARTEGQDAVLRRAAG